MANYVDGFVLPVPKKKLAAYRRMAREAGKVMRELGALAYVEAVADDVKPGKWTSFPQSVKLKSGEVVVFSYIVYKSRRARDRIMPKFMNAEVLGPEEDALRRQAHVLGRVQAVRVDVGAGSVRLGTARGAGRSARRAPLERISPHGVGSRPERQSGRSRAGT